MNRAKQFGAKALEAYKAGPNGGLFVRAAKVADEPTEILVYGPIGESFWGDEVSAPDFLAALAAAGPGDVTVRINSPGGDVFHGMAIYNAIRNHGAVTTVVDGLAASAASYIALAGQTVVMNEMSTMMIHNASTVCWGDRNDMTKTASTLGTIDAQIGAVYAKKTGKPSADMAALMDAETWMDSAAALEAGFCDEIKAAPDSTSTAARAGKPKNAVRMSAAGAEHEPDTDGAVAFLQQQITTGTRMMSDDSQMTAANVGAMVDGMQDAHSALTGDPFDTDQGAEDPETADMAVAEVVAEDVTLQIENARQIRLRVAAISLAECQ